MILLLSPLEQAATIAANISTAPGFRRCNDMFTSSSYLTEAGHQRPRLASEVRIREEIPYPEVGNCIQCCAAGTGESRLIQDSAARSFKEVALLLQRAAKLVRDNQ